MTLSLRIALISDDADCWKASSVRRIAYTEEVARQLALHGHRVDRLTLGHRVGLTSQPSFNSGTPSVDALCGPSPASTTAAAYPYLPHFVADCLAQIAPPPSHDLAHACGRLAGWVAHQLKRSSGLPYVLRLDDETTDPWGVPMSCACVREEDLALQAVLADADGIVVHRPEYRLHLMQRFGIDHVRVIPRGFHAEPFAPPCRRSSRAQLGLPDASFVILQTATPQATQDLGILHRALRQLDPRACPLVLMAGDGEDFDADAAQTIARSAERHALTCVTMGRGDANWRRCCAAANAFFIPSAGPDLDNLALSAMACGVPVVTRCAELEHIVVDGHTGCVVASCHAEDLTERLEELWRNPRLACTMGLRGLQRTRCLFSREACADALLDFCAGILHTEVHGRHDNTVFPPAITDRHLSRAVDASRLSA